MKFNAEKDCNVIEEYLFSKIEMDTKAGLHACWFAPDKELYNVFVQSTIPKMLKMGYAIDSVLRTDNGNDIYNAFLICWNLDKDTDLNTVNEK